MYVASRRWRKLKIEHKVCRRAGGKTRNEHTCKETNYARNPSIALAPPTQGDVVSELIITGRQRSPSLRSRYLGMNKANHDNASLVLRGRPPSPWSVELTSMLEVGSRKLLDMT